MASIGCLVSRHKTLTFDFEEHCITCLENRIEELEEMLTKKLELIRCGIGANYSGNPYENQLYQEAKRLLNK